MKICAKISEKITRHDGTFLIGNLLRGELVLQEEMKGGPREQGGCLIPVPLTGIWVSLPVPPSEADFENLPSPTQEKKAKNF
jgi:hypothetical protein